jgi:hypothetical protein
MEPMRVSGNGNENAAMNNGNAAMNNGNAAMNNGNGNGNAPMNNENAMNNGNAAMNNENNGTNGNVENNNNVINNGNNNIRNANNNNNNNQKKSKKAKKAKKNNNNNNTKNNQQLLLTNKAGTNVLNEVVQEFFKHQLIIKLFHFQTQKYGAHKTSDKYLSKFLETYDTFLETAQGIYGRVSVKQCNLSIDTVDDTSIFQLLDAFSKFLSNIENTHNIVNTDLLNLRDEMLGATDQFKYLLTFQ